MSIATYKTNVITIAQTHQTTPKNGVNYIQTFLTVNGKNQPMIVLRDGITYEFQVSTGSESFGLFRTKHGTLKKVKHIKRGLRLRDVIIKYEAKKTKDLWYGICLLGKNGEYVKYIGNYIVFEENEHVLNQPDELYGLKEGNISEEVTYDDMKGDLIPTGSTKEHGFILDQKFGTNSTKSRSKYSQINFEYVHAETKWTPVLKKLSELENYVETLMLKNKESESRRNYQTFCKWFLFAIEWESIITERMFIASEVHVGCAKAINCLIKLCDELVPAYWIDSILVSSDKIEACVKSERLMSLLYDIVGGIEESKFDDTYKLVRGINTLNLLDILSRSAHSIKYKYEVFDDQTDSLAGTSVYLLDSSTELKHLCTKYFY